MTRATILATGIVVAGVVAWHVFAIAWSLAGAGDVEQAP